MGSTEIDSASDAVTTSDTDASWTATHNITGAFVQSGVNITVSVEAVVDDQLCDPAFASLLVPGGQYIYVQWQMRTLVAATPVNNFPRLTMTHAHMYITQNLLYY